MENGFYIGPVKIYYYAVIIIMGIFAALWLSRREARNKSMNPEILWDMVPWLLVFFQTSQ